MKQSRSIIMMEYLKEGWDSLCAKYEKLPGPVRWLTQGIIGLFIFGKKSYLKERYTLKQWSYHYKILSYNILEISTLHPLISKLEKLEYYSIRFSKLVYAALVLSLLKLITLIKVPKGLWKILALFSIAVLIGTIISELTKEGKKSNS